MNESNIMTFQELLNLKIIPPDTVIYENRDGLIVTWKQIPVEQTDGYNTGEKYLVSDQGDSYTIHCHRQMKNHDNGNGYVGINLRYGGKTHRKSFSHTIWNTFSSSEEQVFDWQKVGLEINHLDENPSNNSYSNLQVCTHKENCNYGHHNERIAAANKGRRMSDEQRQFLSELHKGIGSKPVVQLDLEEHEVSHFSSITDAAQETGIDPGNISAVCNNRRHTAGGYRWEFA